MASHYFSALQDGLYGTWYRTIADQVSLVFISDRRTVLNGSTSLTGAVDHAHPRFDTLPTCSSAQDLDESYHKRFHLGFVGSLAFRQCVAGRLCTSCKRSDASVCLLHIVSEPVDWESSLSATLSLNAAISASVVLASRLEENAQVFALLFFSVTWFALFPIIRPRLPVSQTVLPL